MTKEGIRLLVFYQTAADEKSINTAGNNAPVIRSTTTMTEPWCRGISPRKVQQIKIAVEDTCELCREYTPVPSLELHGIPSGQEPKKPQPKERERNILVVCSPCHRHIHELPVPEKKLRGLIEKRPFWVRKEILCALGYVPKHYSPPDDVDIARVFEETTRSASSDFNR
jgi:hypothetical protein